MNRKHEVSLFALFFIYIPIQIAPITFKIPTNFYSIDKKKLNDENTKTFIALN